MPPHELVVTHQVAAPPEQVHRRWLSATELQKWWWPNFPDTVYEVDGRVGGDYRITSAAAGIGVRGRYTRIEEPNLIELTWIWLDDGQDGPTEKVAVEFAPHDGGTLVTVTHQVDGDTESYRQGWEHVLGNLAGRGRS